MSSGIRRIHVFSHNRLLLRAFLLTPTKLFKELRGFDNDYAPAYYEETDYCIRLQKKGYKINYEPRASITHFEFGSSDLSDFAFRMMSRNRLKLIDKHNDFLAHRPPLELRLTIIGAQKRKNPGFSL